jgi:transposase
LELPTDISSLQTLVLSLLSRLDALAGENALLKAENADLRRRLDANSGNSHKPPSSDGLKKKPAFSKPVGKKSGGQLGHDGHTLKMVSTPDHTIIHHLSACPCCHKPFCLSDVHRITHKRQVFDLPPARLEVTEHQLGITQCCGRTYEGDFPPTVTSLVQYGSQIKSLSVLLSTDYKMPFDKIEQLFSDLYGCSFNQSTALSANTALFTALEPIEERIKTHILASDVVHFDETGMRVAGQLHWFHTAATDLYTYLFVHPKRGQEALNAPESLIKDFKNWAIHDCWATYFGFKDAQHALCNAHIIRELEALKEQGKKWAKQMQDYLFQLFDESQKATKTVSNQPFWLEKYNIICQNADQEEPPPIKTSQNKKGKLKNSKGRNLLNRLIKHQQAILAFAFVENIPFTNNQAERDIRCLKTKQKVANSFRKVEGTKNYARIQGFIATIRKHKINVFKQIQNVFNKKQVVFKYD